MVLAFFCMHISCSPAIRGKAELPKVPQANRQEGLPVDTDPLDLEGGFLTALDPLLLQKDDGDSFIRELWVVQWRPNDPIYLYIILPRGVRRPPLVFYLYSYPAELDRLRDDRFCRAVTDGGVAAVGFTPALTGHRYKNRPMREWFVSELREALVTTVQDVRMVLDYLGTRGDLDIARAGIFGQGSGGTIAILAAATEVRIKALDVINPWAAWQDWMQASAMVPDEERAHYLSPEYLARIAGLDPIQWMSALGQKRFRLTTILSDPLNPDICLKRIMGAAPQGAVIQVFPDSHAHAESLINNSIFDWIKDALGGAESLTGSALRRNLLQLFDYCSSFSVKVSRERNSYVY